MQRGRSSTAMRLVVIVAAVSGVLAGCSAPQETPERPVRPVRYFSVEAADAIRHRSFPGVVMAAQSVDLSFRVGGTIQQLPALEGARVAEGEVVAVLDPRDYETALAGVESALEAARAEFSEMTAGARPEDIRVLEAQVQMTEAQFTKAAADFARGQRLYAHQAIPLAELEALESMRDALEAQVAAARANLEAGRVGARQEQVEAMRSRIRGLQARLAEARDALEDTVLRAPFDGTITRRLVDNFTRVPAGQPVLIMQDLEELEIAVQIPERDFAQAPSPDFVEFVELYATFEAVPNLRLPLTLREFQVQADPVTQTYRVTFAASRGGAEHVTPGMTAQVRMGIRLLDALDENAVMVPIEAVLGRADGASVVWVIDEPSQTVRQQMVRTGSVADARIEVLEGLAPGSVIAATGVTHLSEGTRVRPLGARQP